MSRITYNRDIPGHRRLLPAWLPLRALTSVSWRGFVHYLDNWYIQVSPWPGKLRVMFQAFGIRLWCSHGSDEKPVTAGVSCVGRLRRMNRDVAYTPRRLSAGMAGDRKQLTNANATSSKHNKAGQRQPATRWATRRKAFAARMRATRTKTPRFGLECTRLTRYSRSDKRNRLTPAGKWPDMVVVRISSASAPLNGCFQSHFCESLATTPRLSGVAPPSDTARRRGRVSKHDRKPYVAISTEA